MQDERPLRVAVIIGSTRSRRLGPVVARWLTAAMASRADMTVDLVDLAEMEVPVILGDERTPPVVALAERLTAADGFVVVTPEYNHSFPASLKAAIDWYADEWYAKPVGFVSYGGVSGGLRAVEHLRQVFAELHAVTVRTTVSFSAPWERFGRDGSLSDARRYERAAAEMLEQLAWWGDALRRARARRPYAEVA